MYVFVCVCVRPWYQAQIKKIILADDIHQIFHNSQVFCVFRVKLSWVQFIFFNKTTSSRCAVFMNMCWGAQEMRLEYIRGTAWLMSRLVMAAAICVTRLTFPGSQCQQKVWGLYWCSGCGEYNYTNHNRSLPTESPISTCIFQAIKPKAWTTTPESLSANVLGG